MPDGKFELYVFEKNKNYVKLLISYDGVNWKGIEKIIKTEKKEHEACSKLQPIGMIINDDICFHCQ